MDDLTVRPMTAELLMHVNRLVQHRGMAWIIVAWLTVMVICSAFFYAAENGINKLVNSPFDALWWGVSTITIVGYGDTTPVTTDGKLAAMVLMRPRPRSSTVAPTEGR